MVRKAVFLFVFMLTALVTAAPYIGPEMPVDEPVYAEQIMDQWGQDIAFDGTNYLVVWCDQREQSNELYNYTTKIYGARVSPQGELLDKSGFAISNEFESTVIDPYGFFYCSPSIAFDGTNYLVTWLHEDGLRAARVTPATEVLDPDGIVVGGGYYPDVAFDGENYLIVWYESSAIHAARVSIDGALIDADSLILASTNRLTLPAVAFDGVNYRVIWNASLQSEQSDVLTTRVAPEGTVLDSPTVDISTISTGDDAQGEPDIACYNGECLAVWRANSYVEAALLNADGTISGIPFVVSNSSHDYSRPAVTSDGTSYLVAWSDVRNDSPDDKRNSTDIYIARVTEEGTILDPEGIMIRSGIDQYRGIPAVAYDGENYFIAWTCSYFYHPEPPTEPYDYQSRAGIHGDLISSEGAVMEENEIIISADLSFQLYPHIVFAADKFLMIWYDARTFPNNYGAIYGKNISKTGVVGAGPENPLDAIQLANAFRDVPAAVDYGGGAFLILWKNNFATQNNENAWCLYAARLLPDGTRIDAEPYELSCTTTVSSESNIAVTAFDGANFLVVWQDVRIPQGTTPQPAFYARRIPALGIIPNEAAVPLAETSDSYQVGQALVFDGTNHVFVWEFEGIIRAMRITPDMTLLDPDGIVISNSGHLPLLAFDDENYLIAWSCDQGDACYARMTPEGTVIDAPARTVSIEDDQGWAPSALVYDGFNYLLTLMNKWSINDAAPNADLSAVMISSEGELMGSRFVVADAPEHERMLKSVASPGDGTALIAYQHSRNVLQQDHHDYSDRVVYRMFYSGVEGARCEDQAHCGDGLVCTGNICVDPNAPDDVVESEDDVAPDETMVDTDTVNPTDEEVTDETMVDADTSPPTDDETEDDELTDNDTTNPTDGDKLDTDTPTSTDNEVADDESTDSTATDNDFPPFDYDFADYGKDNHPACSCSIVF